MTETTTDPTSAVEALLAEGGVDAVEEAWLARVEENPREPRYFAAVARALAKASEPDNARFLLELLDEHLSTHEHWPERLELLRWAGDLWIEEGKLHPEILSTLEKIEGGRPSYAELAEKVGLHRAVDDIPKIWKKADRLRSLLTYDIGSIVHMEGKGAGRVEEVNMALESFKVTFENNLELRVGFGGAAKLLLPLLPGHILHRKLEDLENLQELAEERPSELLRAVLESYEAPRTGAEIKRDVLGIVAEKRWTSWWAAARKHPQVLMAGKRAYAWAASSEHAQDAVWQKFEDADPRRRIELLRRDGERDPELKARMSAALVETAEATAEDNPGLASEIWLNLERADTAPAGAAWAPQKLISRLKDPRPLFAGIRDRVLRDRAYRVARGLRKDWPELYAQLMWQEQDPRSLDLLSEGLHEESSALFETFFDQLVSQPRKNPAAFTWLVERACDRRLWMERNPMRLLKQLFWARTSDDFAPFRAARLVPLADSGGTVPRILSLLTEEQAAQAAELVERSPGLDEYQRQPLLNTIHLRFPALREEEAPFYATPAMIATKRAELKEVKEAEIPANRRAIEEAREMGDLRENFEYKSARDRHEYLSARAGALAHDLGRVRRIDPTQVRGSEVIIGSRVRLVRDRGERTIVILGPWESAPENNILSNESEQAQTLLGTKLGESVELSGTEYRVESIEPWE